MDDLSKTSRVSENVHNMIKKWESCIFESVGELWEHESWKKLYKHLSKWNSHTICNGRRIWRVGSHSSHYFAHTRKKYIINWMSKKGALKNSLYILYRCGYSGYCGYLYLKSLVAQGFWAPLEVATMKKRVATFRGERRKNMLVHSAFWKKEYALW